jgi:hypothetical protein
VELYIIPLTLALLTSTETSYKDNKEEKQIHLGIFVKIYSFIAFCE